MTGVRFCILRILIDSFCAVIIFFVCVLCCIHYGIEAAGVHFAILKLLLGIVGIGLSILCYGWLRASVLAFADGVSVWIQCNSECHGVIAAFRGMVSCFGGILQFFSLNTLVREALSDIRESVAGKGKAEEVQGGQDSAAEALGDGTPGILKPLKETQLGNIPEKTLTKSLDYVASCILGYCCKNKGEEKDAARCAAEAFALFVESPAVLAGQVITIITLERICRIVTGVVFAFAAVRTFNFSLLNVVMCCAAGTSIYFVLSDAIIRPLLMHGVVTTFSHSTWTADLEETVNQLAEEIAPVKRLIGGQTKETVQPDGTVEKDKNSGDGGKKDDA